MSGAKYKIFVINLDASTDRLEAIARQMSDAGLAFERIPAVLGRALSDEEISRSYSSELNRKKYYINLKKGEIGCYLSHLKAFRKIIDDDLDYAIILEDDVTIGGNFKFLPELLEKVTIPWDCIKLLNPGNPKKVIYRKEIAQIGPDRYDLVAWRKPPVFNMAQIISKAGARKLVTSRSQFFRPADVDIQYYWENDLRVFGIFPETVSPSPHSHATTMQGHAGKYHNPIARFFVKIDYYLKSKGRKAAAILPG